MTAEPIDNTPPGDGIEGVVLIHGLARSTGSMWILAQRLEAAGFATARVGYPSTRMTLAQAVDHVEAAIRRATRSWRVIHMVGHSLGGVIARMIAERASDLPVGRVVQLGAPNAGSELAEAVRHIGPVRAFFGPVLDEIPTLEAARDQTPNVGAIAGAFPLDAIGKAAGLRGPNDAFVSVESAWHGAEDRISVPSIHGWMPLSPSIGRQVATYLRSGRFEENP